MVKNLKYLISVILFLLVLFVGNTVVNATDSFTTKDGINVTKKTSGSDGSLEFTIKNATFNNSVEYKWGISISKDANNVDDWYSLDIGSTGKTANFILSDQSNSLRKILVSTNTAYLYVKDTTNDKFLIDGLQLDLTLDPAELVKLDEMAFWYNVNSIYGIKPYFFQFVKTSNGKDRPESGWKQISTSFSAIDKDEWVKDNGTYYLWIKYMGSGTKIIYGYTTVTVDDKGPNVTSIQIASPYSGTYNTPQTVKINVYFNEGIKGSTTPTLKIKFGDSPERTLTNGTIKNTGSHFLEYSYNIQDTDKGQLQTVSFSGGNITDEKGNKAVLSCPLLSGGITIKANTKATTTNNTANQNTTNNNTDKTNSDKNNVDKNDSNNGTTNKPTNTGNTGNSGSTGTTNNTSSTNKKDPTVASGKIPQTGVGIGLTLFIVAVFIISILAYSKYKKLKDI